MIQKRWVRTAVIFAATAILLVVQDYFRDDKPPKLEPPTAVVERLKAQQAANEMPANAEEKVTDGETQQPRTGQSVR